MAVGTTQLFDTGISQFLDGTSVTTWEAQNLYASVYQQNAAHPTDSWSTRNDITHSLATGDGASSKDMGTKAVTASTGKIVFDTAVVSWGSSVSVTAKYFIAFIGDEASPQTSDPLIFWVNLYDGDTTTEVSSVSSTFSVDAHASDGWFYIAAQT